MPRRILMAFGLAALSLLACAHAPGRPAWTEGKDPAFPPERFMLGVGSGDTLTVAQQRAREELASQFTVKVKGSVEVVEQETQITREKGTTYLATRSVTDMVRVSVDETLTGVEIRQTWTDPDTRTVWALAVLSRLPALQRLNERMEEIDAEVADLLKKADAAGEKLGKVGPLLKARERMRERGALNAQYQVVNPTGVGLESEIKGTDVTDRLRQALAAVAVHVDLGSGEEAAVVARTIVKSLTLGGLTVRTEEAGADLLVRGKVEVSETDEKNGTGFRIARVLAAVEIRQGDRVIGRVEDSDKEGAKTFADASRKAMARLTDRLLKQFNAQLNRFLAGE